MGKLEKISTDIDKISGVGDDVIQEAREKQTEASDFRSKIDSLNMIDEDSEAIKEQAIDNSREIANTQIENYIDQPINELGNEFDEIKNEADEASGIEQSNAEVISNAAGDYSSVSSNTENSFRERATLFDEQSQLAVDTSKQYESKASEIASQISSLF